MEKYLVIYPDAHTEWMECEHNQLVKSCYKVIGCNCVENVRTIIPDVCLIVDESGKVKHQAQRHNELASTFYAGWLFGDDDICGPAVVAAIHQVNGEFDWVPLNEEELDVVLRRIKFFSPLISSFNKGELVDFCIFCEYQGFVTCWECRDCPYSL